MRTRTSTTTQSKDHVRANRQLMLVTAGVAGFIIAVMGAVYILEGLLQPSILSAAGRAAVVVSMAAAGAVAVELLARHPVAGRTLTNAATNPRWFDKKKAFVFTTAIAVSLAFALWHGLSAGASFAAQTGVVESGWLSTALQGTAYGFATAPDSFLSGWVTTVGIAGLLGLGALLLTRRQRRPTPLSTGWGAYTVLVMTGIMAHLLLI